MVRKDEFLRTHPDIRTGMEAYDNKGERLGVIERVDDDSITIEKGHIFHHDISLPYDAIEDIRQDQVIIRRGEGFEEGRTESEEELERQYERDRSAREEQFEGKREEMYEREGARGGLGTEETAMGEGLESRENLGMDEASMQEDLREREWEESPRREPGLEEADVSSRARAGSGWEERETLRSGEEVRVPVREEELEAQKREREGELRIHKEVHTETQHLEVPVEKEEVTVERVPVEEGGEEFSDENAFREQDIRIPIREEEVEVTKKPVVKEEIRARKETRTETEPVSGEVRKEEVKVEPSENVQKK